MFTLPPLTVTVLPPPMARPLRLTVPVKSWVPPEMVASPPTANKPALLKVEVPPSTKLPALTVIPQLPEPVVPNPVALTAPLKVRVAAPSLFSVPVMAPPLKSAVTVEAMVALLLMVQAFAAERLATLKMPPLKL